MRIGNDKMNLITKASGHFGHVGYLSISLLPQFIGHHSRQITSDGPYHASFSLFSSFLHQVTLKLHSNPNPLVWETTVLSTVLQTLLRIKYLIVTFNTAGV